MPAATDQIANSESLRTKLQSVVEDPDFKILVRAALEYMGPYRKGYTFQEVAHAQSMVSGGREAVDLFINNLFQIPKITPQADAITEYVSPTELFNLM